MKVTIEGDKSKVERIVKKIQTRIKLGGLKMTIDNNKAKKIEVKDAEEVKPNIDKKANKNKVKKK